MKKIAKSISVATEYQKWYSNKGKNTKYTSSNGDYYEDVLAQLLICQNGLCAYTEDELVSVEQVEELKKGFKNGKFSDYKYQHKHIQLDHFNSKIKNSDGWNFDNFFAILSYINHNKLAENVDDILKPDATDYEPEKLLEYDSREHIFVPHQNLDDETAKRIENMINTLGINYDKIKLDRKEYIEKNKILVYQTVRKYPTAYTMYKPTKAFKL